MTAWAASPGQRERGQTDESPRLPDAVLAIALAVAGQLDLRYNLDNSTHYGSDFAAAVVVAVATLVLAWRRRWPLATLCVVAAAIAVPQLFGTLTFTLWGHFVPLLVAAYTVARWSSARSAAVGAAIVGITIAVVMLRVPSTGSAGNIPFAAVPAAGLMVAGRVLQRRHARAAELADRAHRLEVERETDVAAALADERSRIARELHDVVAHCVSVMVVQAGVSEALLDQSPDRAREPLRAVQETGHQAIAELTRMLGLLRAPGESSDLLSPQPGVAQLPELVERLRVSGLTVELAVEGEARPLPPGVDLTVFRVVQESLTNVLKHAGPAARCCVELRYAPRQSRDRGERRRDGHRPGDERERPRPHRHGRARVGLRRRPAHGSPSWRRVQGARHAARGEPMIRVLVADDQALVRGGFRSILETHADIEVVGEAEDGQEAVERAAATHPDVVLMDIRMPRLDGLAATSAILAAPCPPKVLILTTFDLDDYVYDALRLGASGFLLKSAPPRELAGAVRTVVSGEAMLAPEITRRLIEDYVARARPAAQGAADLDRLTPRETEVLLLIARGHSNAEIAGRLYLSEPTVKTHVTRVLAKLGVRDRVQAVVRAYETGLVRPGEGERGAEARPSGSSGG